ncbi:MAG: hypothetical protein JSV05_06125 [Candidatus Bathyarchaeota archaeon]|nr:MAG: hypothetical protein JSV05_06125 [Candidatus Bathyarchaeota archaeon]
MKAGSMECPYSGCGQVFEQPVMVTDHSKLPRETYYACPHCMLRLKLSLNDAGGSDLKHVQAKAMSDFEGFIAEFNVSRKNSRLGEAVSSVQATRPSKSCRHFLGYLRCLPLNAAIPDECAVCSNLVQCYIKRE